MRPPLKITILIGAVLLALIPGGCRPKPPGFTEAEGTVTINGKPLPNAQVEFVPMLEDFGAQFNSVGITDESGHFTLQCGSKAGAAMCHHRVVVREGPLPPEARGQSEEAQRTMADYMRKLKNRPIPDLYGSVGQTPLRMEVNADEKVYNIDLRR